MFLVNFLLFYIQEFLHRIVVEILGTEIQLTMLAVRELPRSGTPEQLRAWAGIDADAIVKEVKG